ncbi:Serine/threonine protein kinase [hydrothermal vent metagenome]|uniref:Serine/threonine protein kinase n=1 Tax=hydrothermal vent metagenome TaxID=652676 RepID=A0A3B0YAY5_9ZZZZ
MRLLDEGLKINNIYEIDRYLGSGAFAEVYRVKHRFLGRQAMKIFKSVGMTIEKTEDLLGEAVLLSQLGHPNIVRVFNADIMDTSNGVCGFFTMEYVAGGTLDQFWRSHGDRFIPVKTTVDIMKQVCLGLSVAHSESTPIIHRDIKPQNILVGYDAGGLRAKVSDFGLAKRVNPLTLLASSRGTRCFKAPEAFDGMDKDSCAGDVWALGSVLYLLLVDRLPYAEVGDEEMIDDQRFERPLIPPSRFNVQIGPDLDQIIFRALALKSEDRYPTAREFLEDLSKWESDSDKDGYKVKKIGKSQDSKMALGTYSSVDSEKATEMMREALILAQQQTRLNDAADLMEESFNMAPQLRHEYEYRLKLWRRGVVM